MGSRAPRATGEASSRQAPTSRFDLRQAIIARYAQMGHGERKGVEELYELLDEMEDLADAPEHDKNDMQRMYGTLPEVIKRIFDRVDSSSATRTHVRKLMFQWIKCLNDKPVTTLPNFSSEAQAPNDEEFNPTERGVVSPAASPDRTLLLEESAPTFVYRRGEGNVTADPLSRNRLDASFIANDHTVGDVLKECLLFYPSEVEFPLTWQNIQLHQQNDPTLITLADQDNFDIQTFNGTELICYHDANDHWRIVIPEALIEPTLIWYHGVMGHAGSDRLAAGLRNHLWFPTRDNIEQRVPAAHTTVRLRTEVPAQATEAVAGSMERNATTVTARYIKPSLSVSNGTTPTAKERRASPHWTRSKNEHRNDDTEGKPSKSTFRLLKQQIMQLENEKKDKRSLVCAWRKLKEQFGATCCEIKNGHMFRLDTNDKAWTRKRINKFEQIQECIGHCWNSDDEEYWKCMASRGWSHILRRYACHCDKAKSCAHDKQPAKTKLQATTGANRTDRSEDRKLYRSLQDKIMHLTSKKKDKRGMLHQLREIKRLVGERPGFTKCDGGRSKKWGTRCTKALSKIERCIEKCWNGSEQAYLACNDTSFPTLNRFKCACRGRQSGKGPPPNGFKGTRSKRRRMGTEHSKSPPQKRVKT